MGVVNATPDSFSDGGRHAGAEAAIAHGRRLIAEGAAIVDIGGESTRPGAQPVSFEEECARVLPVVTALAPSTLVSIDTCKAGVADAALAAGAQIVNDVSGGLLEPAILGVVARQGATIVLGHLRGTPATMIEHARYEDVVREVREELGARVAAARAAGIPSERIWIDPGLGFGKTAAQSIEVLANLDALCSLGHPIVVGASRKSFLSAIGGAAAVGDREEATAAAHAIAILRGAEIVRVHDVARQLPSVRIAQALRDAGR